MADNEVFSIKKMVCGFFSSVTWAKSVVYLIMIVVLLLVGYAVYKAYFVKPPQVQHTTVTVQQGGTANITNVQKQEEKRKWWMPIPFVSVFGEARGSSKSSFDDLDYGYGAQAGIRWDF